MIKAGENSVLDVFNIPTIVLYPDIFKSNSFKGIKKGHHTLTLLRLAKIQF